MSKRLEVTSCEDCGAEVPWDAWLICPVCMANPHGVAFVVGSLEELLRLPSWCLRWSEALGAWLYFPPTQVARVS